MSATAPPPTCAGCGASQLRTELGWSEAALAWFCEACFAEIPATDHEHEEREQPHAEPSNNGAGPAAPTPAESTPAEGVSVVTLQEFISVDERGAESLVGSADDNLIPEGGDVMFYGDGGTAKTTLTVDLAFHLAAVRLPTEAAGPPEPCRGFPACEAPIQRAVCGVRRHRCGFTTAWSAHRGSCVATRPARSMNATTVRPRRARRAMSRTDRPPCSSRDARPWLRATR